MTKIVLVMPKKGDDMSELQKFLSKEKADIYIFPEGFISSEHLTECLKIICELGCFVITGLKDKRNNDIYETALVIDSGKIIGEYKKCVLAKGEKQKGKKPGNEIHCIDTRYGKIGIPICYEIHFPEVVRSMALEEPIMLVNLIGTGMYHELQLMQWTTLAKARAIENEVFVFGCSHNEGEIPLAFAYSPKGEQVLQQKNYYGSISLEVNLNESREKAIGYFEDRVPEVFSC